MVFSNFPVEDPKIALAAITGRCMTRRSLRFRRLGNTYAMPTTLCDYKRTLALTVRTTHTCMSPYAHVMHTSKHCENTIACTETGDVVILAKKW